MTAPSPITRLTALAVLLAIWCSQVAAAGYVWMERSGDVVQVRQGKLLTSAADKAAAPVVLAQPRAVMPDGKTLAVERLGDAFVVRATPGNDLRFTAIEATQGVLTHYQARFGRSESRALNDLELVPTEPNGNTYKLVWKGQVVAASEVSVEHAEGWRRSLTPAKDGTIGFTPWMPGVYVLNVSARVNDSTVMYEGRKYEDVRHNATLSFEVRPAP